MTTGREKPMKKVSLLGKINYIFDKKQKRQLIGLGIMIFIGGILGDSGSQWYDPGRNSYIKSG